jgi:hypothetical protein
VWFWVLSGPKLHFRSEALHKKLVESIKKLVESIKEADAGGPALAQLTTEQGSCSS